MRIFEYFVAYAGLNHDVTKVSQEKNTIAELKRWIEILEFDPKIESYKEQLLAVERFSKSVCVGNQFLYIVDLVDPQIVFISSRVRDVLGYEPKKFYDDKIAGLLFISPSTVISHRKNMMEKTGTINSSELIAHVVEQGLDR